MVKSIVNETNEEVYDKDIENVIKIIFNKFNIENAIYNVVFVSEDRIRQINKEYRNKDSVTDVISFAFEEEKSISYGDVRFLGEIYVCASIAKKQALEYGHSEKREICYEVTHGFLHLLGYDHIKIKDKKIMREKEEEILSEYDLKR